MEYKKGDKVRCKKFFKDKDNYVQFYNGSVYEIINAYPLYDTEVDINIFKSTFIIQVKSGSLSYEFREKSFYEHFNSKKELRKLKLKKIIGVVQ